MLENYIDLKDTCLTDLERKQVMEMLYKYRDVFSLRDEFRYMSECRGEYRCYGQFTIFITPYHVREEDRAVLDKEMRRLYYLGILKEGFSAYSSPVMLISRKMTSDKRVTKIDCICK